MSKGTVNKVILIGRLGNDPDVRYLSNGEAVTKISVATDSQWKDRNTGQMQDATEWHRVTFFGKLGEIAGQYLRKGSRAYIEGRIRTNKWRDQSGQDRYTTEIIGDQMQMLDSKASSGSSEYEAAPRPAPPRAAPRSPTAPHSNYYDQPPPDFNQEYATPPMRQALPPQAPALPPDLDEGHDNYDSSPPNVVTKNTVSPTPSNPYSADEEFKNDVPF